VIGQTLSHYRITAKLGEGGMGEVYRAHDERLDRDVAIKVLPEEVAGDADRLARFEREAKAVAKLAHPNILDVYELGEHEGRPFMATELLEGETLRERLGGASLGWRKATEIGAAIADGLGAAHEAGIFHRDLKPSNVFLTADGRVKVLDFGLARHEDAGAGKDVTHAPTITRQTDPGTVLGTVGYMSPEQVRGEPADHRSDIFSLGCVLYELVCGRRAFSHDTAVETMNAILKEEPTDLRSLTGDLSPSLANIVRRCLEKRPEARFQTGQDLAFALRATLKDDSGPIARTAPEEKSIVVLPFDNLSPDPDQEYFADGLTEEIISDLAKIRDLRVISRNSSIKLKGTDKDTRTIGRELGVQYLLEGSVRKAGNNLRITAQLIEAESDRHLWADKFTGTMDDVFDFQEKVSRSIVEALEVELSPGEDQGIAERPVEDVRLYELLLRAQQHYQSMTEPGTRRGILGLEEALDEYGENTEIRYHLADALFYCEEFGLKVEGGAVRRAEECARVVAMNEPNSSRVQYLLGRIERFRGNTIRGLRHFERAFALDPDSSDTLMWLAISYSWQAGYPSVGVQVAKRLVAIDPLWPFAYFAEGMAHWFNGDLDEGVRIFERASAMEPDATLARMWIAFILMWKGELDRAFELTDQINQEKREADFTSVWNSELLMFARYALRNEPDLAMTALSDASIDYLWNDADLPWNMAALFALMNRKEDAYRWLERALARGSINYRLFAHDDPFFENLRGDERFQQLMDLIKPKWERFEVGIDLSGLPPASGEG
jgi:serine/threonine protein kinase/tetratricopeptide (TPR) repeat protein